MKLYCFPRSGNSREVRIVLAEKGIMPEKINVHAPDFNKEDPDFKKASPGGKVPAIIDGDVYLSEAYKINEYLEDKYPQNPLLPKSPEERKKIHDWVALYDKKLVLKIGLLLIECVLKPKDQQKEETKQKLRQEILGALKEIETLLTGKEYLFGAYSLADISLIPHLAVLPRLGVELDESYPQLKSWLERMKQRPSFSASAD
jgi:glutathione S-transferase